MLKVGRKFLGVVNPLRVGESVMGAISASGDVLGGHRLRDRISNRSVAVLVEGIEVGKVG